MAPKGDKKFVDRASVVFGRPGGKKFEELKKKEAKKKGSESGCCGCFGGIVSKLMGFPEVNETKMYQEPKPLEPVEKCIPWADLQDPRKEAVKLVEVGSTSKEGVPGWTNQDSTSACAPPTASDGAMFFCVFDGHGRNGHDVSGICAERLPAHLAAFEGGCLSDPKRALEEAFKKTDDDIFTAMGSECEYSGSTGVAMLLDPITRMLTVGNVGDSRAVLGQDSSDGAGQAIALTEDNKPDFGPEKARIELSGGTVQPMADEDGHDMGPARVWESPLREKPGLAVSRSLGDGAARHLGVIAEPVVSTHQLQIGHKFALLASDGLWDSLSNDQAVKITTKYLQRQLPRVAIKALTEAARREEGGELGDDTTVVLVVF